MSDPHPLSLKIWADVVEDPTDGTAWTAFFEHYWKVVYTWAYRRLGREHAAEEVAADVFETLFRRISNGDLPPVQPNDHGSFRPYVYTVVVRLCEDYRRSEVRRQAIGLTLADVGRLEDPASIGDLSDRVAALEEFEQRMDRYRDVCRRAIRDLKAAPQYDDRTFQAFLLVYHQGMKHRDVDLRFGQVTGWSSKSSARVRERLVQRMTALDGRGESALDEYEEVVNELVRLHGESSD